MRMRVFADSDNSHLLNVLKMTNDDWYKILFCEKLNVVFNTKKYIEKFGPDVAVIVLHRASCIGKFEMKIFALTELKKSELWIEFSFI